MLESPLRKLRKSKGMSLDKLRDALVSNGKEITSGHLSYIERGEVWAGREVVDSLVSIFEGELTEMDILYPFGKKKENEDER